MSTEPNRLGYRLRRVQKTKPLKKVKETDAIFANVHALNKEADADPEILRISIDVKAKVAVGNFSREGEARGQEATKANDHDMNIAAKLVPVGILEVVTGHSSIIFGNSQETSDLIVDCVELWWRLNLFRLYRWESRHWSLIWTMALMYKLEEPGLSSA